MSENRNYGRNTDGTFSKGNAGRPRGARNKTTQAVAALLEGEADRLTRKAIEMALEGDTVALRLCLERIHPPRKDAPVPFDLPEMSEAESAAQAMGAVLEGVARGDLTPSEAGALADLVEGYRKALETTELEERLTALEARQR
ncbi:MAG: hypothetical protein NXH70_07290 [Hyphomonas sp.]|nr:hypothetical protein [Hyphomonas sp.]